MDKTLYKIEFDGELSEGYAEEDVKKELRSRFKLDEKKITRMFSGDPLILKKGIERYDAENFIQSFLNIGVVCTLHPLATIPESMPEDMAPPVEEEGTSPIPPVPEPPVDEDEEMEISLLMVRDVLGFTGNGLTNPESEIRLVESAGSGSEEGTRDPAAEPVDPVEPDYGEIEPVPDLLEVEKSHGPPGEMSSGDEETHEQEQKFRIVFSGEITEGQNQDDMKQSLAQLLGIEKEDTNILFSQVPVVLKDNLEESRAIQYRDQYRNTGAQVIMEPSENLVGGFLIE